MKEHRDTKWSVPWCLGGRGRAVDLYLDQFGSLRVEPDSVGSVIIDLHKRSSDSLRMVNLLDDDSDEESPVVSPKVGSKVAHARDDSEGAEKEVVNPKGDVPGLSVEDARNAGTLEDPRASPPGDEDDERQEIHEMRTMSFKRSMRR